jgi:hypothetical protein
MIHNTRPNHVQININQALDQMGIHLHGGGMITIFPKGALATFSLIIFLACPACNQLHGLGYDLFSFCIPYDEMNMV